MSRKIEKISGIVERITVQSRKLFRRHGYKKTTVNEIALKCKISKKTLYEMFPSKEVMLMEVLHTDTKEFLRDYFAAVPSNTPAENRFMLLCRFFFSALAEHPENDHLWSLYSDDATIHENALSPLKLIFKGMYEEGFESGQLKSVDPAVASEIVVRILKTTFHHMKFRDDIHTLFNEALSMIADSISNTGPLEFEGFKKDYYRILGISRNASPDEMKRAYRKLALKYHPDQTNDNDHAGKLFIDCRDAYEILKDRKTRAAYDAFLAAPFSGFSDSFSWEFKHNNENNGY